MDPAQKAKLEQGAVAALAIIFGLSMFGTLKRLGVIGGKGASRVSSEAIPAAAVSESPPSHQEIQPGPPGEGRPGSAERIEYGAESARDPLVSPFSPAWLVESPPAQTPATPPPPAEPAEAPPVTVQGIILGGPRPQALIDRKLYEVGDMVDGARIVSITREGVAMAVGGSVVVVRPPSPLSPANVTRAGGGQP